VSVVTNTTGCSVPRAEETLVPAGIEIGSPASLGSDLVNVRSTQAAAGGCLVRPIRLRKVRYAFSGNRFSR
jgi:hypothetical protein